MTKQPKPKYKNIKLEQQELTPTALGAFESRKRSSISTFIILSIFVLVVIFLPEISNLVDSYLKPNIPNPIVPTKPTSPINPINPNPDLPNTPSYNDTFYTISNDLEITREDIKINKVSLDTINNTLNFTVTNITNKSIALGDLNYYLELYNKDKTLIERLKITGIENVAQNYATLYQKELSTETINNLSSFVLITKNANEYPAVAIKADESGKGSLVCTKSKETVTYKFNNNALKELTSELKHSNTESDYSTKLSENKQLSNNYNLKTGISSSFIEYTEGYTITSNINLNEAKRLYIFNADSFSLNTEPKIVNFEMEAQGFKCE